MRNIVRFFLILTAFTFSVLCNASEWPSTNAIKKSSFKKKVETTYKEYAWTVVFGIDNTSHSLTYLSQENLVKLKRIFTNELALALFNDAKCARTTQEICALDFDILFDSQDPDVRDLTIKSKSEKSVEVCFIERAATHRCLEVVGASDNDKRDVKIDDIKYDQAGRTLRTILKLKR